MFKKKHINTPDKVSRRYARKAAELDKKMDELISLLTEEGVAPEKIHELRERFNRASAQLPVYKEFMNESVLREKEMDIILSNVQIEKYMPRASTAKQAGIVFRMVISVLLITMGFAMIILPTPGTFEIYTLFYFNPQDGFTLMDLISLIIVFCGIYTLITIKRNK